MEFKVNNKIIGLPVRQNQQEFLLGIFTIDQVLKFTKYTSRLIIGYNDDNIPQYNEYAQREVETSRVEQIADFLINDPDATFPTNLVLHIPIQSIESQKEKDGTIEVELNEKVFEGIEKEKKIKDAGDVYITIIDGQHRIRGIEIALDRLQKDIDLLSRTMSNARSNLSLSGKLEYFIQRLDDLKKIQLVITFFIDKTPEYQAMIFSTINRTQKRVSENLVYSLFGLTTKDSPQKSALQITIALNAHKNSPFYNRIKLYGGGYKRGDSPPLSQATMVKSIVYLISENWREADNDKHKERKELTKKSEKTKRELPFRIYYALNEDTKISDILYLYYKAVKESFIDDDGKSLWDFDPETMKPTNVLHTTVGYQALLSLLIDILSQLDEQKRETDKFTIKTYLDILQDVNNKINVKNTERYPFTSKSKKRFYLDLNLAIWPPKDKSDPRLIELKEALKKE